MTSVGRAQTVALSHRLIVRQLLTRGRALALAALGAVLVLISFAVGSADLDDPVADSVSLIDLVGFTLVVPIVALVFAAAALGDPREDGTLVYLWLRPMDRGPIVVGAWLAAITVALPLTLPSLVISAALLPGGSDLIIATALSATIGVVAYCALFVLLGLLVRNPVIWGVGYVLLWEGLIAQFGTVPARIAVRGYTRSILASVTDVDLDLGELSVGAGIVGAGIITVAALAVASARLNKMEID
ncbi:MAG: ABC transporter permease subunit [Actinomycetota bacterium]